MLKIDLRNFSIIFLSLGLVIFSALSPHQKILGALSLLCLSPFFLLLAKNKIKIKDLIIASSLISTVFLSIYFPIYGIILGANNDPEIYPNLKSYVGLRSITYTVILLIFISLLTVQKTQIINKRETVAITLIVIGYFLTNGILSSANTFNKIAYLLNSFLPLALTIFSIPYLMTCQDIRIKTANGALKFLLAITFFCTIYTIGIEYFYSLTRPDLASVLRSPNLEPMNYGEYPLGWETVIGKLELNRLVGTFPDPILAGYFFAFIAITTWQLKKKYIFFFSIILLILTFSKGAYIFLAAFFTLNSLLKLNFSFFWPFVILSSSLQILAADMFHSSAYIHFLGLKGAVESLIQNPSKIFFGFGVGTGGNLEGLTLNDWSRHASLSSGSESGVGVILFQTGLVGFMLLIFSINYSKNLIFKISKNNNNKSIISIVSLLGCLCANSFLQENIINSSILGMLLLFSFIITEKTNREENVPNK